MKHQITENQENIFFFRKKCPGLGSDLKYITVHIKSFNRVNAILMKRCKCTKI